MDYNGYILILAVSTMLVLAMLLGQLAVAIWRSAGTLAAESVARLLPRLQPARVTVRASRKYPTDALPANQAWRAPPTFLGGSSRHYELGWPDQRAGLGRRDG